MLFVCQIRYALIKNYWICIFLILNFHLIFIYFLRNIFYFLHWLPCYIVSMRALILTVQTYLKIECLLIRGDSNIIYCRLNVISRRYCIITICTNPLSGRSSVRIWSHNGIAMIDILNLLMKYIMVMSGQGRTCVKKSTAFGGS